MDACELEKALRKHSVLETPRPPLFPADKNNGTNRRYQTREVSSRYKSPTPLASSCPRRSSSPSNTTSSKTKRAASAERKRPSTPSSPRSPSTPVQDTSVDLLLASKKNISNRLPDVLWPSRMRSLSVAFQSDTFSLPISKREKQANNHALSDRNLRPPAIVAHKQIVSPPVSRKPSPERKRSPLKGKNSLNQSENSKPVESLHARLADQHRWPIRRDGKLSSIAANKSMGLSDETTPRRMSMDGMNKPLQKSSSNTVRVLPNESGKAEFEKLSFVSSTSLEKTTLMSPAVRSQSLPTTRSRAPSLNKTQPAFHSSVSRGLSPSRARVVNPDPSRGSSPSQIRPSSPSKQSNNTNSVLTFIADIRKGKKIANHIEDAHQLRLLYNRHLQWRYANARKDAVLHSQKVKAEKILYSVWRTTSELWDSVTEKRIDLEQLRLKLKLHSILNEQMAYLGEWASIEKDHTISLSRGIQDLQATTLRLPVNGGARADVGSVKAAICSAVDVLLAMGSSICSINSRVEGMNCLLSNFADLASQERALFNEWEALITSTTAMQVEEHSLRTHLIQSKQAWNSEQPILGN